MDAENKTAKNVLVQQQQEIALEWPSIHFKSDRAPETRYGKKIPISTSVNDKSFKIHWNSMMMSDISMHNQMILVKNRSTSVHHMSWYYAIIINDGFWKGCCGLGVADTKVHAEAFAFNNLYKTMNERITTNPFDSKKLLKGGVEQNPGPQVKINAKLLNIQQFSGETMFTLPNKFSFVINNGDFYESAGQVVFNNLTMMQADELEGRLQNYSVTFCGTSSFHIDRRKEELSRSTIYSNHKDFKPSSRLNTRMILSFQKEIGNDVTMALEGQSSGEIFFHDNFIFLPKNLLFFRFSRENRNAKNVDPKYFAMVLASVANQKNDLCTADRNVSPFDNSPNVLHPY